MCVDTNDSCCLYLLAPSDGQALALKVTRTTTAGRGRWANKSRKFKAVWIKVFEETTEIKQNRKVIN